MMRFLRQELGRRLADVITEASEYHLLTDGKTIYLKDSAAGVVDVLRHAKQAIFGVCLTDTVLRLKAECKGGVTKGKERNAEKKHPKSMTRVRQSRAG
jgi:hypothetical protein